MTTFRIQTLLRIGTVAAALAVGGVAAHAQPEGGHHGRHHGAGMMQMDGLFGGHMRHLLKVADATDAQRSQIEAIFKAARQDLAGQREARMNLHRQMAALYTATNVDAVAIESVRAQLSAQREAASRRMSQASIEAARVLSPEQRARIAEAVKQRRERMAERPVR